MKSIPWTYRFTALLSCLLAIALLFLPIVWLEVGPNGYKYYGPTVPHVYIYGGAITGKDLAWEPIAFAMLFQLICILIFCGLSLSVKYMRRNPLVPIIFQSFLLTLFPVWLEMYVSGVENNSDGADLRFHWQIGMVVYVVLVGLNVVGIVQGVRGRNDLSRRMQ